MFKELSKKIKLDKISKNEAVGSMTISFVINEKGKIKNKKNVREDFKGMKIASNCHD